MKPVAKLAVPLLLAFALAAVAPAAEQVVLSGQIVCAKCTLKKADAKVCQNVLVVTGEKAGEYYIARNAVADAYGEVCTAKKPAKVTGRISEKDGRKWIEPSKIEDLKS